MSQTTPRVTVVDNTNPLFKQIAKLIISSGFHIPSDPLSPGNYQPRTSFEIMEMVPWWCFWGENYEVAKIEFSSNPWHIEVFGKKYLPQIEGLAKTMSKRFNVNIEIELLTDKPKIYYTGAD